MRAKGRRIIHPETSELIESLLRMLEEKGEEETFAYVRSMVAGDRAKRLRKTENDR